MPLIIELRSERLSVRAAMKQLEELNREWVLTLAKHKGREVIELVYELDPESSRSAVSNAVQRALKPHQVIINKKEMPTKTRASVQPRRRR
ncbi:MAG: hypothetical protein WAV04_02480 [Candidatus Microsaccharimonas sp.]|jgi:hypothetical protein